MTPKRTIKFFPEYRGHHNQRLARQAHVIRVVLTSIETRQSIFTPNFDSNPFRFLMQTRCFGCFDTWHNRQVWLEITLFLVCLASRNNIFVIHFLAPIRVYKITSTPIIWTWRQPPTLQCVPFFYNPSWISTVLTFMMVLDSLVNYIFL